MFHRGYGAFRGYHAPLVLRNTFERRPKRKAILVCSDQDCGLDSLEFTATKQLKQFLFLFLFFNQSENFETQL